MKEKENNMIESNIMNPDLYKNYKNFGGILHILQCIFLNELKNESYLFLKPEEIKLLNSFMLRKFKIKIEDKNMGEEMLDYIKHSIKTPLSKRPEEKYKFVFKRSLKFIKDKFR